ncbi:hypothetical protein [Arsenicitalea aurantiaca]|uniref:hypothetical protein n=1 Tax=Arsenicitalea aurantiaca TaxID=1783274 RepID=UPI00131505DD|nr:hypothetical protein [Arsenicitalea aurantiaca]
MIQKTPKPVRQPRADAKAEMAQQVFRQFAWNLAGSVARQSATQGRSAEGPAGRTGKR